MQKVVYLLGSGATHGVMHHATNTSLLTRDIQDFIRNKGDEAESLSLSSRIWNELVTDGRDVEHIITVLDSLYHYDTAIKARNYYQEAIVELSRAISEPVQPNLYTVLGDLHLRSRLAAEEELTCFLSLNYEDILERSLESHLSVEIDYGIRVDRVPSELTRLKVIKLHGSFSWENNRPITLQSMSGRNQTVWIPPGVDKRKEHYPFNLLWGQATEFVFDADIIRVIGCSLSRNDWSLIPIIYTAQTLQRGSGLRIELIDFTDSIDRIVDLYPYLQFTKLVELDEVRAYNPQEGFPPMSVDDAKAYFSDRSRNIFDEWLRAKIAFLYTEEGVLRDDILVKEDSKFVAEYFTKSKLT